MRNLSREAFEHDNPYSRRHAKDKRDKEERDEVEFVPVPSPLRAGGKDLTGIDFDTDSAGLMFEFGGRDGNDKAAIGDAQIPQARAVDPQKYRKRILLQEKERQRYRRTIRRKSGDEVEIWAKHEYGAVSMVVTVPPWAMPVINQLEDDLRDQLMLATADVVAARMRDVSGRVPWGGGLHYDTDIAHFHFQVPKTSPDGENWAKTKFKTGGPWLVGADRIDREFPGLLTPRERERLDGHKARKGQLVDLEIAEAVDSHLEEVFREMGLEEEYIRAKAAYAERKKRARVIEQDRLLLKAGLRFFVLEGIWPLAATAMRFAMWRMIPKEIRLLIFQSIRVSQVIASPSRAIMQFTAKNLVQRLKESSYPEPEPLPPFGKI